jgi:hypothetical protein
LKYDNKKLILKAVKDGSYPRHVYKYRDISDRTKDILRKGEFWFANPSSFNDPFDCNLSESQKIRLHDLKKHFSTLAIAPQNIQKYIEINKKTPNKIREMVIKTKNTAINKRGILSLSANHNNILMWSHYASNHSGLVICLDILADPEFFLMPINIKYVDSYTESNYLKNAKKSTDDSLKLKSKLWKYEEEIRIYKKAYGLYQINKNAIAKIYFGVKTKQAEIDEIIKLCKDSGYTNVNFFKAHIKHAKFELVFTKI